jgi:dTDP-4-amino-4,6-dideoxygalactose transaminase
MVQHPSGTILLPFLCQEGTGHTWNQFVIRLVGEGKREGWKRKLVQEGVQSEIYYPRSMHEQTCFTGSKTAHFPAAEAFANEVLALPLALSL